MNGGSALQSKFAMGLEQFGDVQACEQTRMQRLISKHTSTNWTSIPHVTHHDEVDVTDLEELRLKLRGDQKKLTALPFYMKAVAIALTRFPRFNASLDAESGVLYLKQYVHIGFAVDSPRGLVVAVVRDCDGKSVLEISAETVELASQAREKGLPLDAMLGGCFTISSLGKSGGSMFTPIINGNEVAILGVSRLHERPVRHGDDLIWRTMSPLSLSYDHRVLNGAQASQFMTYLRELVASPQSLLD